MYTGSQLGINMTEVKLSFQLGIPPISVLGLGILQQHANCWVQPLYCWNSMPLVDIGKGSARDRVYQQHSRFADVNVERKKGNLPRGTKPERYSSFFLVLSARQTCRHVTLTSLYFILSNDPIHPFTERFMCDILRMHYKLTGASFCFLCTLAWTNDSGSHDCW